MLLSSLLFVTFSLSAIAQNGPPPSPWVAADIGAPQPAGSTTYDQGVFSVAGGGPDIRGSSDEFHFVYQPIAGDVEIVARIDSLIASDPWAKVGVMIRGDLTASAAHGFAAVSAGQGLAFVRRLQSGASTRRTLGDAAAAPQWVRLVRIGGRVTAFSSADGNTWQTIGAATIALPDQAYVGLAITSRTTTATAQAQVSQVTVTPLALPAGQHAIDVGTPSIAGTSTYRSGVYSISAGGTGIGGAADQFRFVYQQASGDIDVAVRVPSLQEAQAEGGIMIRESLAADARQASALFSTAAGYTFKWRLDPGGSGSDVPGPAGSTPAWVRLVRTGQSVEAFQSTDGANWNSMGQQTIALPASVYVGIAVASRDTSLSTTATADNFTITEVSPPPNGAPTVSITAPADGASFTAPANITITADARDPENRLARVEFYAGSTLIGAATNAPYTANWTSVGAGSYTLTAVAFDADGGSATSAPVAITVAAAPPPPAPRTLIFTASIDHDTLVTSYRLDIFASGADPATSTPVASTDLGKPDPDPTTRDITVDLATFFGALAPGSYLATVSAIGVNGENRSAAITFTR